MRATSCRRPVCRERLGLLQHRLGGLLLLIGRVAVLAQDALHVDPQLRSRVNVTVVVPGWVSPFLQITRVVVNVSYGRSGTGAAGPSSLRKGLAIATTVVGVRVLNGRPVR